MRIDTIRQLTDQVEEQGPVFKLWSASPTHRLVIEHLMNYPELWVEGQLREFFGDPDGDISMHNYFSCMDMNIGVKNFYNDWHVFTSLDEAEAYSQGPAYPIQKNTRIG